MYSFLQTVADSVPPFALFFLMLIVWSVLIESFIRVVSRFTQSRSASERSFVLQAGFVALAIAPVCYLCMPGVGLHDSTSYSARVDGRKHTEHPFRDSNALLATDNLLQEAPETTGDAGESTARSVPQASNVTVPNSLEFGFFNFVSVASWIWASIAAWQLLHLVVAHLRLAKVIRSSQIVNSMEWRTIVEKIAVSSRISPAKIQLRTGGDMKIPMVAGFLRPVVLLPTNANQWNSSERELVLRHEIAHLERYDLVWQAIALTVRATYWFQPLTWQSWRSLQFERECACDDIALNRGAQPTMFAKMLHKIATEYRGNALPAGIAMAEKNRLEERVTRTLDEDRPRSTLNRRQRIAGIILALCCTLLLTSIRPFSPQALAAPVPEQSSAEEDPKFVTLPLELEGSITTEDGTAIPGADVKVEMIRYYGHDDDWEIIRTWTTKSDANGKYVINLNGKIRQPTSQFMITYATAPGHADACSGWGHWVKKIAKRGTLSPLKMNPGRMVSGRVVGPDGQPIPGARIRKSAGWPLRVGESHEFWFPGNSACDANGRFEFGSPNDKDAVVSLIFFAEGFAPTHLRLRDTNILGDIRLEKGTAVEGVVLDKHGQPLPGVCVAGTQTWNDTDVQSCPIFLGLNMATLTDNRGRFKLNSNVSELSLVRVVDSARDEFEGCVRGDLHPPVTTPMIVKADKSKSVTSLEIREAASTVKVAGHTRWLNGDIAAGVKIRTSIYPFHPDWPGGSPWLSVTHSDANGQYFVEFPANTNNATVCVFGSTDAAGKGHGANANQDGPADIKSHRMMKFNELTADVHNADWTLGESPGADGSVGWLLGTFNVEFVTGPSTYRDGDWIEITEVRSTSPDLKVGDFVFVKGKGHLESFDSVRLCLYTTSVDKSDDAKANPIAALLGPLVNEKLVENGEFEFELSTKVTQKGYQHLTFYKAAGAKAGKPLGGVYFGTNEQMNAIKELDVSYYLD